MTSWLKGRLGRMRVSTIVLIVAFLALFWVYHNFEPRPAPSEAPPTAVVPPGFVPDPNYTWVPRTYVRRPKEPETTTTTTTTSPTTTTPSETTSPTSPTETTPTTTVIPGPLGPQTVTLPPTVTPTTPPAPAPGPAQTTPPPPG
jgi:cytoskeletal protein RodZ